MHAILLSTAVVAGFAPVPFPAHAEDVVGVLDAGLADAGASGAGRDWAGEATRQTDATVEVLLEIDEHGAVTRCHILQSSGYDELDTLTCDTIAGDARFRPERDEAGKAIAFQYRTTVTYRLEVPLAPPLLSPDATT